MASSTQTTAGEVLFCIFKLLDNRLLMEKPCAAWEGYSYFMQGLCVNARLFASTVRATSETEVYPKPLYILRFEVSVSGIAAYLICHWRGNMSAQIVVTEEE